MKPNDSFLNPAAELPEWLLALQQAVSDADIEHPTHILLPGAATDELVALLASAPPVAPEDRSSLRTDIAESLDSLGSELSAEIETALDDFRRETLSRLPELLSTREGIQIAVAAASVLQSKMASAGAIKAAWRDTVATFRNEAPYENCLSCLGILRELVEARGHAWETETERITRILNDSAAHARQAGADIPPPPQPAEGELRRIYEEQPAGLSESARLSLIESDLARPATDEEVVVWLRIDDAVVQDGVVELGPVRFIDARFLRSRALANPPDYRRLGLPEGYEQMVAGDLLSGLEEDTQAVLARIETTGARANAVAWARRAVSGLLDIATLGEMRPGWELTHGHYVTSSSGTHFSFFQSGDADSRSFFRRLAFRPDLRLAAVDKQLVSSWAAGDVAAEEAIDLARWEQSLSLSTDESFRVALGIRNLERVLPSARVSPGRGAHWTRVVTYYLKDVWCWAALSDELENVCFYTVTSPMRPLSESGSDDYIGDFYNGLRGIIGGESPTSAQLIEHVTEIAQLVSAGSSRRRILDRVARNTATSAAAQSWLAELGQGFDVLIARAARQRNATVHGAATVPAVIATVSPFVGGLGKRVVEGAMASAANGELLAVWFEQARLAAREKTASLEAGKPLAGIMRETE